MFPAEIAKRAEQIRLKIKDLGKLAGITERTAGRTLGGKTEPFQSTAHALEMALVAEEIRLLRNLAALHPDIATLKPPLAEAAE